jgi:hypothetical protein
VYSHKKFFFCNSAVTGSLKIKESFRLLKVAKQQMVEDVPFYSMETHIY